MTNDEIKQQIEELELEITDAEEEKEQHYNNYLNTRDAIDNEIQVLKSQIDKLVMKFKYE